MSNLLQTILFGTFFPPDVPGRKILFDERSQQVATAAVPRRKQLSRSTVIDVLKNHPGDWLSIGVVSAECGVCDDTAAKVLNALASEHLAQKRFAKTNGRGGKTAVFKWIEKHGKKQKTA